MNIPSLSEITARISALVDRWNRRENQLIAFLSQPEGEVTVTDGLERDHRIPSLRSLIKRVTGMADELSGESAKTQAHVSAALSLRNEAQEAAQSASASSESASSNAAAVSEARGQVTTALGEVRTARDTLRNSAASAATSASAAAQSKTSAAASASAATQSKTAAAESARAAQAAAGQATENATAAASAAASAQSSSQSASAARDGARDARQQAQVAATSAGASKQEAAASATAAESSASAARRAQQSASSAAASAEAHKQAAAGHEHNAWQWAVGQPVGGSAKHWAEQAQAAASGALTYQGAWQASTGTYPANPRKGHFYRVSSNGSVGGVQYRVGDQIIYNGQAWEHVDNTESVTSVAGRVGDVVLTRHDIHGLGALASADSVDYGSQVRNKPDSAPRVHAHSFAEITGKPAAYPPAPHRHAWGDIDGKPATSTRWPRLTEVEGLQAELDKRPRQIKTVDDISQRLDSGYYQTSQPGPGWPAGAQGWWHLLSVTHGNPSNYYALQIASSHSWSAADYYIRCTANNGNAAWDKLWHSRNFDPDTKLNVSSYHWDNLPGKPPLAAQGHTHTIANVTGLQDALNARLNAQLFHWAHLPGKPDLAAASHRHPMHSIDGLTAELASRFKCHDSGASGYLPPNANHVGSATGSMRSGSVDTPTSDWTQIFSTITADTRFGFQIASPWHTEDLYHRHLVAGQFRSWRRIWDAGNFDPASKLDASSFRWDSLPGKPDLAAASHQHTVASIQGLQPALDGKHPNRAMLRGYCHVPNGGWNNAAENGWYHGPDMANAPLGGWLMGQVIAHNALWVRQDVYPFTSGSAHTRYVRYKHNGSWAPWHKIRDSAHRVFTGAQMPTSGVEDGDIWIVP